MPHSLSKTIKKSVSETKTTATQHETRRQPYPNEKGGTRAALVRNSMLVAQTVG